MEIFPLTNSLPSLQACCVRSSPTSSGSSELDAINCEALALNIQLGGQFCFNTQTPIAKDDKAVSAICKRNLNNNPSKLQGKQEQVGANPCFTLWRWLMLGANWQEAQKQPTHGHYVEQLLPLFVKLNAEAHSTLFTCLGDFWQLNTCSWCKSSVCG